MSKGNSMKHSWLTLSLAAVTLSGCGSMVYGPTPAPVMNNSTYGQQVPLNPNVAQNGNVFGQAVRPTQQPQPPVAQARPANTVQQPVRPPVAQAPSPYRPPQQNAVRQGGQVQGGWDTPVQPSTATPPRVYDEPKLPGASGSTAATAPVTPATPPAVEVNNRPTPIRPPERTTAAAPAPTAATPDTQPAVNTPPPVQTTRRQPGPTQEPQQVAANNPRSSASGGAASGGGNNNTAVSSLLKQASASLGKGDLDGAAAYLENAQRIEPQNSKILYDIANIRYHQGRHREAESMASRAVQVGSDNGIKKKAWSLISKSRSELGDHQGAINAANKANDL